jgi:hypothetical protein
MIRKSQICVSKIKKKPFHAANKQNSIRHRYKDKNQLLVCRAVTAHCKDHTQYINILYALNADFPNDKTGGAHSYHCDFFLQADLRFRRC